MYRSKEERRCRVALALARGADTVDAGIGRVCRITNARCVREWTGDANHALVGRLAGILTALALQLDVAKDIVAHVLGGGDHDRMLWSKDKELKGPEGTDDGARRPRHTGLVEVASADELRHWPPELLIEVCVHASRDFEEYHAKEVRPLRTGKNATVGGSLAHTPMPLHEAQGMLVAKKGILILWIEVQPGSHPLGMLLQCTRIREPCLHDVPRHGLWWQARWHLCAPVKGVILGTQLPPLLKSEHRQNGVRRPNRRHGKIAVGMRGRTVSCRERHVIYF